MFSHSSDGLSLQVTPALSTSFAASRCSFLRRVVVIGCFCCCDCCDDDDWEEFRDDLEERELLRFLDGGVGGSSAISVKRPPKQRTRRRT